MKDFLFIMPEIVLALTMAFVIAGEITYFGEKTRWISAISLLGLGGAFVQTLISYQYPPAQIFGGVLCLDGFALFFKMLFIIAAGAAIAALPYTREIHSDRKSEYCTLILASALAMCLLASASDLILIFLSMLFLNVISYFLAAYGRKSVLSTEASVKYLTFGTVATALLLYAFAILFASTHSLNIYEIHRVLVNAALPSNVMLVAFILSFLAFSFQMGAFPMHLIVPDVLEGAPTPVSSFLSLGARAAGFAVAIRFIIVIFAQPGISSGQWQVLGGVDWPEIVAVVSGLTMIIGALLAFKQTGAKRLVAYLVVVETGFLLMGLLVLDEVGIAALLYNLVIQLIALTGSFYVLSFLYDELRSDRLEKMKGMLKKAVPECICLMIFLLSLVGSPPFPGFVGKFTLLGVVIRHHRLALGLVGVLSMVISTAAVARMAYYLVGDFQLPSQGSTSTSLGRKIFLGGLLVPLALTGVLADWVFRWASQSLGFIFW